MADRTERQTSIIALADELAGRFAERAARHDADRTFPFENYRDLHESGYLKLVVPPEYGGEGADLFDMVLAQERLGRGDGSTAMAVDMTIHLIGRLAVTRTWPEAIYADICRDIVQNGALINAAASEPELGSPSRGGLPSTTATRDGDGWRVNGHKLFVSMAPALRYIVTSVAIAPSEEAPEGASGNAIVRADAEGVRIEDTWSDALSLRSSGSSDIFYDNVYVPDAWLIDRSVVGQARRGGPPIQMAWFGLTLAAVYLGIGQAASDTITRYANERIPTALGRPIATLPLIQRRVGEIEVRLQAARAVLYDVAQIWVAHPERHDSMASQLALAKYLCTNAAIDASDHALRIAGGFGLTRKLPLERFFRDARAGITHPPNDDAALELIGKAALS
jgi:alkylation response protein AidB-like acyl-CoA dehydrogenase